MRADQVNLFPFSSQDPASSPIASANFGNNSNTGLIFEPQLNYETFVGKGHLSVLAGSSVQQTRTKGTNIYSSGYANDALINTISNATFIDGTEPLW